MFSFLSTAISGITGGGWQYYVIGGLVISLSASAWYNKHQIDEYALLNASYSTLSQSLKDSQNSLEKKDESCKIDDQSVVELDAEKKVIQDKSDDVEKGLLELKQKAIVNNSVANITNTTPKKENSKEVTTNETNVLPDDGRLSANLILLLHKSYCNADPTADSCSIPSR